MGKRVSVLQDCRDAIAGQEPVSYMSLVFYLRHIRKWEKLSAKKLKIALQAFGYVFRSLPHSLGVVEYISDSDFNSIVDKSGKTINAF